MPLLTRAGLASLMFPLVGIGSSSAIADVFTNVPEASSYSLVYDLAVPVTNTSYNTTAVTYAVNNSASYPSGSFTRAAYYLELGGSTDPSRRNGFIYASFNRPAVFVDGGDIGVPSNGPNGSGIATNTTVASMNIVSNVPGIITGSGLAGGKLEFWPSNYGTGTNGVFDYDDDGFGTTSAYASMQIHNVNVPQTLFAYNGWGGNTQGSVVDLGIGTNTGDGSPDWTFATSADRYTVRRMQILVSAVPEPTRALAVACVAIAAGVRGRRTMC
jgi:hypothetical protein